MQELLDRITEGNCTDKKYRVGQSFGPEKIHLTQACAKPTQPSLELVQCIMKTAY